MSQLVHAVADMVREETGEHPTSQVLEELDSNAAPTVRR
jgi:hypothetical protein